MNPWFMKVSIQDRLGRPGHTESTRRHLDAAIEWLCRAQDLCDGRGVSAGYSLIEGWHPPYPETTGYIIPTFYDYADLTGNDEYRDRARRMADWEIEVQLPSGAVQGGVYCGPAGERLPVVFNTGQVILGWCRAYRETSDERYLAAAIRAGRWLVAVQAPDGSWRLDGPEVETSVHAYDARTAWSLLELDELARDGQFLVAAEYNLAWTMRQQLFNGWFKNNSFSRKTPPPTHTISYVMEGLIEAERLTGEARYLNAVLRTAKRLLSIFELRKFMPGEFDENWNTTARYSCLTGDAQIAGVWLQLFQKTGEARFLNGAIALNNYVKATQNLHTRHPGIRGGVKGSHPISGTYQKYLYPNWAAKFLADSLMLESRALSASDSNQSGSEIRHSQAGASA
jgi:uncharacterized protein YyaL (SSP411 family)